MFFLQKIQTKVLKMTMAGAKRRQAPHSARIIFQLTPLPTEVSKM